MNATRFLIRTSHPMADDFEDTPPEQPYSTTTFWASASGCDAWTLIMVIARTVGREIAIASTDVPPTMEVRDVKNILLNVYDEVKREVGQRAMDAALNQSLLLFPLVIYPSEPFR
jgi:hypothetical protein